MELLEKTKVRKSSCTTKNIWFFNAPFYSVAFSPDTSIVTGRNANGAIKIYDIETRIILVELLWHIGSIYSLDFNSDGSRSASNGLPY